MQAKRRCFGVTPLFIGIIAVCASLAGTALASDELLERARAYESEMKDGGVTSDEVRQLVGYYEDYLEKEPDSPYAYWIYCRLGIFTGQLEPVDMKGSVDRPKSYEYFRRCLETAPEGMLDSIILLANSNLSGAIRIYENLDEYVAAEAKVWHMCNAASQLSDEALMAGIPAFHDGRIAEFTGWSAKREFEELRRLTDPGTGVPNDIRLNTLLIIRDHDPTVEAIRRCGLIEKHFAGTVVAEDARKKRNALEQVAREELAQGSR